MGHNRCFDWFRQSRGDLLWAEDTLKSGRFAQACFASQQVAQKAIEALALKRGYAEIRSHSIREIARAMGVDAEVEVIAKRLDQYYISSRYPDALPAGAPFEYFTHEQAEEAVRLGSRMLEVASGAFEDELDAERRMPSASHGAREPRNEV